MPAQFSRLSTTVSRTGSNARAALRRDLVTPLRSSLTRAGIVAVFAGLLGGAAGLAIAAAQPNTYRAQATFVMLQRPLDYVGLSRRRHIQVEQTIRHLNSAGRADAIATEVADSAEHQGEWVVGPGFGEVSYQVTSPRPDVATAAARAVYDQAGFLGMGLGRNLKTAPVLDLKGVTPAAPDEASTVVMVGGSAIIGACAGFFLFLLTIVRPKPVLLMSDARRAL